MTVELQSRVVFVTPGEAPPLEVVRTVDHPRGVAEGRELDSFLAELDAGHDVPGLLVAAGGSKVIELLRRHERTACLPIFFWGSGARVEAGWDGNVVRWEEAQLAQVATWHEILQMAHPVAELDEQERREHHFLRYLASRGQAPLVTVAVFGIEYPEAAVGRWQRDGWVTTPTEDLLHATDDLLHKIAGDTCAQSRRSKTPSSAAATSSSAGSTEPATEPADSVDADSANAIAANAATVHADVVASLLLESASRERSAPAPMSEITPKRRFSLRDLVLLTLVGFIAVDLWSRYGSAYFFPQSVSEPEAAAEASSSPATILELPPILLPPELSLDAHLSWEITDYTAAFDGIIEWRSAESGEVRAGEVIAYLVQPQAIVVTDNSTLQQQLDRIDKEIVTRQAAANEIVATDILSARQALTDAQRRESALLTRVDLLQESYDRSRKLAEDGVLSFREIRADWDKLQIAKEELGRATANLANLQLALEGQLQREIPNVAAEPVWQAQIASLRLQMEPQQSPELRIPVVVADNGFFVQRVPHGAACSSGEVLGQLRKAGAGHVEAVLATADWDPKYLQGVARLRRPQRSSWMPTRILAAESLPTGLTLLRLRLPVGWLDGGSRVSVENATQLELRITAPLSSVHENK